MNRFFDAQYLGLSLLSPLGIQSEKLKPNKRVFILVEDLRFRSDIAGGVIVAPQGMMTDFASIPPEFEALTVDNDDPRIALGAVIHDYICGLKGFFDLEGGKTVSLTWQQARDILCDEAMPDLGASVLLRQKVKTGLSSPWAVRWRRRSL